MMQKRKRPHPTRTRPLPKIPLFPWTVAKLPHEERNPEGKEKRDVAYRPDICPKPLI